MADWFLILATSITFLLLLVAAVYFLVYYQHPDDRNDAYFPKLTVILGLVLAGATVLLLPLDVANNEGYAGCDGYDTRLCGGLNMQLFWDIFYYAIPAFVFLFIPFMTFFYEADDGLLMAGTSIGAKPNNRFLEAIKYEFFVVLIFGSLFVAGYLILGESEIPVATFKQTVVAYNDVETTGSNGTFDLTMLPNMTDFDFSHQVDFPSIKETISVAVSLPTFLSAFMAFIGWFIFAIFGGIGLAALPLDMILAFVRRPRRLDPSEFADAQVNIRNRTNELVNIGELLKVERDQRLNDMGGSRKMFSRFSGAGREERSAFLEFKKAVFLLETDVEEFLDSSANYENYNPLKPFFSLLGGIVAFVLSAVWIVQVAVYIAPPEPLHPLLNDYFQIFEGFFPLLGILSVALFSMYLLLCAVKGCFKFGFRFMLFEIHPMKPGKTYMSSFMFNVALVLLCSLPVVQFTVTAFPEYARYTNVVNVMGTQVQYIKFFSWFWVNKVFIYAILGVTGLTTLWLAFAPSDKPVKKKGLFARLKKNKT